MRPTSPRATPALLELGRWGAKYAARSVAPKNIARRIREARAG